MTEVAGCVDGGSTEVLPLAQNPPRLSHQASPTVLGSRYTPVIYSRRILIECIKSVSYTHLTLPTKA